MLGKTTLIPLLLTFKLGSTADIIEHIISHKKKQRRQVIDAVSQSFRATHIWKAEENSVELKLKFMFREDKYPDDWEKEDWTGNDGGCIFLFDTIEFKKLEKKLVEDKISGTASGIARRGKYLRNGNMFVYKLDWWEIERRAKYLMETFKGSHEIYLKSDSLFQFAKILLTLEGKAHCDILEIGFDEFVVSDLDILLNVFDSVNILILGFFNDSLQNHKIINYKQLLVTWCRTVNLEDLLHLNNETIELVNPNKLQCLDIVAFIDKWMTTTDLTFEKLRIEYINMTSPLEIERIKEALKHYPYDQNKRDLLTPNLCHSRIHHYSFLFDSPEGVDFMRPDGLTGTLVNHKNSTYFVVWHCHESVQK